ncbi:response regulator [Thermodesulfovibrio yellowstonii]|uniref:Response regulator n=1 Tax=Thermodesulfovibrio yellowstonii TaxID=28262 RepID=A0A9W6GGJ8_9BACT|nr:response regulator [Thermodesulfovibrio islandicus]GLI53486.1 response regulator [Thermodesulfovibrio islandicus]
MSYKILICEDNEKNRKLMKDLLEYHGYEVYLAENGKEGIEMAKRVKPDLILMDMQMPVLDGFEAIKKIRQDKEIKHIKIISVTSFAMPTDKERVLQAGADYYIAKPIDTRALPEIIKKVIEGQKP